jgi:hypothetical protein
MPRQISEECTRKEIIDPSTSSGRRPQLEKAEWYLPDHSKVKIEIPVDGYDKELWNGGDELLPLRLRKWGSVGG